MPKCTDCEVLKPNLANAQTALAHAVAERDEWKEAYEATDHAAEQRERLTAERDEAEQLAEQATARAAEQFMRAARLEQQVESARETYHAMLDELNTTRKALREWQLGVGDTETGQALASVTAERDALAKRWEALKDWAPTSDYRVVDVGSIYAKMRELEGHIEGTVPYTPEPIIESTAFPLGESQ